jgi:hypothetical protein
MTASWRRPLADFFQAQVENLPDDVLGDRLGLGEADRALGQIVAGKPALDRSDHLRAEREQALYEEGPGVKG